MHITVYAVCYNEEYLLPYFLRHYQTFADKIVVYDNYSTDNSVNLLQKAGVEVRPYFTNNQIRDDCLLHIKSTCWKKDPADWTFIVDIDEIVYHPTIRDYLEENEQYTVIQTEGFHLLADELPKSNRQIYEIVTKGAPSVKYSKTCILRPNRIVSMNWDPGCHIAHPAGDVKLLESNIHLYHCNMLTQDYYLQRMSIRAKRLSKMNIVSGWCFEYLYPQDQLIEIYQQELANKQLLY